MIYASRHIEMRRLIERSLRLLSCTRKLEKQTQVRSMTMRMNVQMAFDNHLRRKQKGRFISTAKHFYEATLCRLRRRSAALNARNLDSSIRPTATGRADPTLESNTARNRFSWRRNTTISTAKYFK